MPSPEGAPSPLESDDAADAALSAMFEADTPPTTRIRRAEGSAEERRKDPRRGDAQDRR